MNRTITIIPRPLSIEYGSKTIKLTNKSVSLCINAESREDIHNSLKTAFKICSLELSEKGLPVIVDILQDDKKEKTEKDEAYSLDITEEGIHIKARGLEGAFYGCISAGQIIYGSDGEIPQLSISDKPVHSWRGFFWTQADPSTPQTLLRKCLMPVPFINSISFTGTLQTIRAGALWLTSTPA